ncbi:Hypothetical_protein [Hexamita inflata]|uniref:Hypothetical_protein n=1 Tax=Hexamita inflata TaxID=28002 RepID=A0AA86R987_9EUKA|nr:Hypothetical protein HINF_LOCUS51535 [Hexamita inflata]
MLIAVWTQIVFNILLAKILLKRDPLLIVVLQLLQIVCVLYHVSLNEQFFDALNVLQAFNGNEFVILDVKITQLSERFDPVQSAYPIITQYESCQFCELLDFYHVFEQIIIQFKACNLCHLFKTQYILQPRAVNFQFLNQNRNNFKDNVFALRN